MATPVAAGGTAQLLEHLIQNINHPNPSSALVKGIFAATAVDMMGQYNDVTNGAGETAPNNHEGWGRINMWDAKNSSFVDRESLSTGEERLEHYCPLECTKTESYAVLQRCGKQPNGFCESHQRC